MAFKKVVIINGQGHLLGRLASVVAKELLNGQHIVCLRCENMNISGSLHRNKLKYSAFLRLRMNTNPSRGPYHFRSPSRIFWRVVRGMIKHKTIRGKKALSRLEVYDGIPASLEKKKKLVVPQALRTLRLKPGRNFCRLGDLSSQVGWGRGDLIKRLEIKRKERAQAWYNKSKKSQKILLEATKMANKSLEPEALDVLQMAGHA